MRITAAAIAAVLVSIHAQAGSDRNPRYRVEEVTPPPAALTECLDEYSNFMSGNEINDFGVVLGNHSCNTRVDATIPTAETKDTLFAWAPWFGALELPNSGNPGDRVFGTSLNNRGEIFGGEFRSDELVGVKWSLSGGLETVFQAPQCESGLGSSSAIAGNARHVVGWGFRTAPEMPPPFDTMCFTQRWVIATRGGAEMLGPRNGVPTDMNAFSVAVGTQDAGAIRYNVATGETRLLRAGDANRPVFPTDLNDLGEAAGFVTDASGGTLGCGRAFALRWDRNDRETRLPELPGAVASIASGVGYDGETIGSSGPGAYCEPDNGMRERAVLWRGGRVLDLNHFIVGAARVTLAGAISTNRRGQILASGFREDDALRTCPQFAFDPATGEFSFVLYPCRYQRLYVLTPL
jgi:hypothetical protein